MSRGRRSEGLDQARGLEVAIARFSRGAEVSSGRLAIDSDLTKLFLVGAIVMGMSHTIAKERIFAPLRDRLGGKETWFGYLVSCPYCVSHYLAFALVPLLGLYPIRVAVEWGWASWLLDWFLSAILVTVVAAFLRVAFWWIDETQALVRRKKTHEEEETRTERIKRRQLEKGEHVPH